MAITSKAQLMPVQQTTFPKLMQTQKGLVVLMTSTNCGTVVASKEDEDHPVGYHSSCWHSSCFTDFNGVVELINE